MPIKTLPQEEPTLNLTPMIDVILTLIIFFMVATKFGEEERSIELKLPSSSKTAANDSSDTPKIVNVKEDGSIFLGSHSVKLEELTQQLKSLRIQNKNICIQVRGDKNARHGRMAEVYEAIRDAGVPTMAIVSKYDSSIR